MNSKPSNSPILFELFESDNESNIEIPFDEFQTENDGHTFEYSRCNGTSTSNESIILELETPECWIDATPPAENAGKTAMKLLSRQCYQASESEDSGLRNRIESNNPSYCNSGLDGASATQPAFILGLESQLFPFGTASPTSEVTLTADELTCRTQCNPVVEAECSLLPHVQTQTMSQTQTQTMSQTQTQTQTMFQTQTQPSNAAVKRAKKRCKEEMQQHKKRREPISFCAKLNGRSYWVKPFMLNIIIIF